MSAAKSSATRRDLLAAAVGTDMPPAQAEAGDIRPFQVHFPEEIDAAPPSSGRGSGPCALSSTRGLTAVDAVCDVSGT